MPSDNKLSRRNFLRTTTTMTGASFLRISAPALLVITESACTAKQESAAYVSLTSHEAADIAAIAARIIPTTDTPGATEAGVIHFIDQALAAQASADLSSTQAGLIALNEMVAATYPSSSQFSELSEADQDSTLKSVEDGDFFGLIRTMTIHGMFAMSRYGGNKDHIGWKLLNFEGAHGGWQYPFGYYDAEIHGSADLGE